jgi:hypothetical protein
MKKLRFFLWPLLALIAFAGSAFTKLKAKSNKFGMPAYYFDQWSGTCASTYVYGLCTLSNTGRFCTVYESSVGAYVTMFQYGLPYYCYQPLYYDFQ